MKSLIKALRKWFAKIRVALWVHPEVDLSRRAVIFGCAAVVASSIALKHIPDSAVEILSGPEWQGLINEEFVSVVRRAFVPRLYVQLYKTAPIMAELLECDSAA